MSDFRVHTVDSAPAGSKPILAEARKALGFVPNLYGVFAESPTLLEAYTTLGAILNRSSLDATDRQIVLLAASFENGCDYCMAAHTTTAGMQGVPEHAVDALRAGAPLSDPRLEALASFTRSVVRERGRVPAEEVHAFLAAGFTREHLLDVVLGVGMKTLSNYTNHLARTPLDEAFVSNAWTAPGRGDRRVGPDR